MAFFDAWFLGDAVRDYLYKQHGTEAGLDYWRLNNREVPYERNSAAEDAYKEWEERNSGCAKEMLCDYQGTPLEEIFMWLNLERKLTGSVKMLYETGNLLGAVMGSEFEACFLSLMEEGSEPPSEANMVAVEKYTKGRALVRSEVEAGQQLMAQLSGALDVDEMTPSAVIADLTVALESLPSQLDAEEINVRCDCNSDKVNRLCDGMTQVVGQVKALSEACKNAYTEVLEQAKAAEDAAAEAEAPPPPPSAAAQLLSRSSEADVKSTPEKI